MPKINLFYQYYDNLFASKNYTSEIEAIWKMTDKYYSSTVANILEIGCGTGNHTLEFSKRNIPIIAIDTDEFMLNQAKKKNFNQNVQFFHGPLQKLTCTEITLALALFNVITYIPDEESLKEFFHALYDRLRPQGLFIFDCWNGTAALRDPPGNKNFETIVNFKKIQCHLSSQTNFNDKKTYLNYHIRVFDSKEKKIIEEDNYVFSQTLWAPEQITSILKETNFKPLLICKPFQPEKIATEHDWKIMFVCQRQ